MTRIAKAAALAAAPTAVLLTLNGFYLGAAYRASPALFWLLDALQFAVVPVASLWALARFAGVRPPDYGLGSLTAPHGALAALPVYVLVIAACVLGYGAARILAHLIALEWNATGFDYTQAIPRRPVAGLLVLLYLSLSAGLVEEIVFRGLPALCLRPTVYPVVSAAAFAAIHWESGSRAVFAAFFLGVVLAALYLWLRNLWPFVGGHAVSDMLAFTGTYAY